MLCNAATLFSLVLDEQGITLNGLTLDLLGQTKAVAKGDGNTQSLALRPEAGTTCEAKS